MNSSNLNLTATHNGFGLNHNHSINQSHHNNHFNSASVLTYRSNRRSMDRSDNKITTDGIAPSSSSSSSARNTLPCNDTIREGVQPVRSFSTFLRFIYKTLMLIFYGISKRRPTTNNNPNSKLSTESVLSRILSILKYRVIGNDGNNYSRSISNDSGTDQSTYIERIDDEHMENTEHSVNVNATAKVIVTSATQSAPVAVELPTGKIFWNYSTIEILYNEIKLIWILYKNKTI